MKQDYFSFKKQVISVALLIVAILLSISFLSFHRLNAMTHTAGELSKPDLIFLQQFELELCDAGNAVKSYLLTHDENDLQAFYECVKTIDERMSVFERMNYETSANHLISDKVGNLLVEKFTTLNQLLSLHQGETTHTGWYDVSEKLKEIEKRHVQKSESNKAGKRSLLSKIFNKNKSVVPDQETSTVINKEARKFQKEIKDTKEDEIIKVVENKNSELALIRKDQQSTQELRRQIDQLKSLKNKQLLRKMEGNEDILAESKSIIINFCIIVLVLLLTANLFLNYKMKKILNEPKID